MILADLPGVDPNESKCTWTRASCPSAASVARRIEARASGIRRVERAHGVFYRRFALPESANPEGISASGRNGVLEITIPKRAETTPRRISVQ